MSDDQKYGQRYKRVDRIEDFARVNPGDFVKVLSGPEDLGWMVYGGIRSGESGEDICSFIEDHEEVKKELPFSVWECGLEELKYSNGDVKIPLTTIHIERVEPGSDRYDAIKSLVYGISRSG